MCTYITILILAMKDKLYHQRRTKGSVSCSNCLR